MNATLYFSTSRVKNAPWLLRQMARIIRIGSLSRIAHVAIGFDGIVLNHAYDGAYYMLTKGYLATNQTLCATLRIPLKRAIDFGQFDYLFGVPIRPWPTFLRWLRRGYGPWTTDCLCTVMSCLKDGGVGVPRRIATPAALHKYLMRERNR